jgi:hypothetical protein
MNNMVEQDHRFVKKRVVASQWFRSVDGALNPIAGLRGDEHHPQGADPMAAEDRRRQPDPLC